MMATYEKCKGENRKGEPCRLLFHERERRHRFTGTHVTPPREAVAPKAIAPEAVATAPGTSGCVEGCGAPARGVELFTTCAGSHGEGQGQQQCKMCPHIVGCPGPKVTP